MKTIQHRTIKSRGGKSPVTHRLFSRVAAALVLVTIFFGCDLFGPKGVTIEERIDLFMKDVNAGNYDKLYTHFHPDDTQQRQQVASQSFWTTYFKQGTSYTYKIQSTLLDVATVTVTGGVWSSTPFMFTLAKSGDDYYILKLQIAGVTIVETYLLKN